jgi:hypothetical protein
VTLFNGSVVRACVGWAYHTHREAQDGDRGTAGADRWWLFYPFFLATVWGF